MPNFHGRTEVVELVKAAQSTRLTLGGEPLAKGDLPGHAFHGNQWDASAHDKAAKEHDDKAASENKSPVSEAHTSAASYHRLAAQQYRDGNPRAGKFSANAEAKSAAARQAEKDFAPKLTANHFSPGLPLSDKSDSAADLNKEAAGHAFHGNQHTAGDAADKAQRVGREARAATKQAQKTGSKEGHRKAELAHNFAASHYVKAAGEAASQSARAKFMSAANEHNQAASAHFQRALA